WTKWLGKLFMRMNRPAAPDTVLHLSEKIAVVTIGVLSLICCIGFVAIISLFIDPYLALISSGYAADAADILMVDNLLMIAVMFIILAILILAAHFGSVAGRALPPYLCGRGVDDTGKFRGSFGVYKEAKSANYYMEEYCGEKVLIKPSWIISNLLMIVMFAFAFLGVTI
ncbi:MAG: hypothetical protein MJ014_06385, partial [Methanocorpusculum sp.]|nr:hypothetical protein [Methanocorpusculum sp.]